jgi:hypothetical protein
VTDKHRFATEFRMIALLDRCVKRIHVNMENGTAGSHGFAERQFRVFGFISLSGFPNIPKKGSQKFIS